MLKALLQHIMSIAGLNHQPPNLMSENEEALLVDSYEVIRGFITSDLFDCVNNRSHSSPFLSAKWGTLQNMLAP